MLGRHSRREFLRRAAVTAGAGFAAPWALDLASLASAAPAGNDYRALVCLFMYGGNDNYDTFIPNDPAGYAAYRTARAEIGRPAESILPLSPVGGFGGSGTFGLAPELQGLKDVFDEGSLAVVANVGTLIRPLDKASYELRSNRPPQLFSHNDQQSFWQSSSPEGATTGWGGRLGDALLDANDAAAFTCVSLAGNAVMMTGRDATQYQMSSNGATRLRTDTFRFDPVMAGLREIMELQPPQLFPASYSAVSRRALGAADDLSAAISSVEDRHDFNAMFPSNSGNRDMDRAMSQLKMVAKMITAGRDSLGLRRQVFFVSMGGFDNHDALLDRHRLLLTGLNGSMSAFHRATRQLGVANEVTTFTASDFGRTLSSNGDGSDHGWGAHHLVMGGAVRGARVYGAVPTVGVDGPDDVGRGRLLPTTSVDQYAATLSRWMGAGSSELDVILPNISNFDGVDLGFMHEPKPNPKPNPEPNPNPNPEPPDTPVSGGGSAAQLQPATRISQR